MLNLKKFTTNDLHKKGPKIEGKFSKNTVKTGVSDQPSFVVNLFLNLICVIFYGKKNYKPDFHHNDGLPKSGKSKKAQKFRKCSCSAK